MQKQDFTNINKFISTIHDPVLRHKAMTLKLITSDDASFFAAMTADKIDIKNARAISANKFGKGLSATPFVTIKSLEAQRMKNPKKSNQKINQKSFEF